MSKKVSHDDGDFWDRRYQAEGAIWGEQPSPTAGLAAPYLAPGARVLDVGSGYGRDLAFLIGRGCHVVGIDASREGHRLAVQRLMGSGELLPGRFEDLSLPEGAFDAVLSHRMAHLLLTPQSVADFAARMHGLLRPDGILAVGARSSADRDPAEMVALGEGVYEYRRRPGHRIRYWDEEAFRRLFGGLFAVLALTPAVEDESHANPVPCRLMVLIARKKADAAADRLRRREEPRHVEPHR